MKTIGSNIRERRLHLNLTLRSLAKKINLSASFLSQVESGKVVPSLSSLKKVSEALNTTIGILVGEEKDTIEDPIVRVQKRKSIEDANNGMAVEFLTFSHPDKLMEPMVFKMSKRAGSDTLYQHFGQEFVLVLKGRIELVLGGNRCALFEGDSIYFNSSVPHAFWSVFDGTTEVLSINTPSNF